MHLCWSTSIYGPIHRASGLGSRMISSLVAGLHSTPTSGWMILLVLKHWLRWSANFMVQSNFCRVYSNILCVPGLAKITTALEGACPSFISYPHPPPLFLLLFQEAQTAATASDPLMLWYNWKHIRNLTFFVVARVLCRFTSNSILWLSCGEHYYTHSTALSKLPTYTFQKLGTVAQSNIYLKAATWRRTFPAPLAHR